MAEGESQTDCAQRTAPRAAGPHNPGITTWAQTGSRIPWAHLRIGLILLLPPPPPQFWTQQSVTRGPHGSDHDAYLCRALFTRHLEYNLNSLPHLARLYTILYCLPGNFKATPTLLSSVPALWVFLSSLKSHSSSLPQDFGCSIP